MKPVLLLSLLSLGIFFQPAPKTSTVFSFDKQIVMEFSSGEGAKGGFELYLNTTSGVFGFKHPQMTQMEIVIADTTCTMTGYMNMGDKKLAVNFSEFAGMMGKAISTESSHPSDPMSFTKTGSSKTICGYTAYEYKGTQEGKTYTFWIADVGFSLRPQCGDAIKNSGVPVDLTSGQSWGENHMMMEMEGSHDGKTFTMKITSLGTTTYSFDDTGYEYVNFGEMMKGGGR